MLVSKLSENNISLSDEQQNALEYLVNFVKSSDNIACVLQGSAGTGKSLIIRFLLDELENNYIPYCLVAPTHKAAMVIKQYTNQPALTLHSLLAMAPKLDILQLDLRDLEFSCGARNEIPNNGVIICDEASMINDSLFEFICSRCESKNTKIIFVGDFCQLQPVQQRNYSKVTTLPDKITLNKIFRQSDDSALVNILTELRSRPKSHFETDIKDHGSLIVYNTLKPFVDEIVKQYKQGIQDRDILNCKVLAYTNQRVDEYNKVLHKLIFNSNEEYAKSEFLTCYDNVTIGATKYWNSMDYIIMDDPIEITINVPFIGPLPGYILHLYDSYTKTNDYIKIISKNLDQEVYDNIGSTLETLRTRAISEKDAVAKRKAWKSYFALINSHCTPVDIYYDNRLVRKKTFDHGYAISVHKSQGSTYNQIFIDMHNLYKQFNADELRQLQYVAMSRTRNNVYLLE